MINLQASGPLCGFGIITASLPSDRASRTPTRKSDSFPKMHSWVAASLGYCGHMHIDVVTVSALCLAQTALISALLVQRSRRRLAEHALRTSETALRSSYQEAQHLAGRLIAAQESERSRLAL